MKPAAVHDRTTLSAAIPCTALRPAPHMLLLLFPRLLARMCLGRYYTTAGAAAGASDLGTLTHNTPGIPTTFDAKRIRWWWALETKLGMRPCFS